MTLMIVNNNLYNNILKLVGISLKVKTILYDKMIYYYNKRDVLSKH